MSSMYKKTANFGTSHPDIGEVFYAVDTNYRTAAQGWSRADRTGPLDLWAEKMPGRVFYGAGGGLLAPSSNYATDAAALQAAIDAMVDFRGDTLFMTPGNYSLATALNLNVSGMRWKGKMFPNPRRAAVTITDAIGDHSFAAAGDDMEIAFMRFVPLTAQNVEGKVRLYGNRLEVDPFSLNLYGGRTQGSLGVDLSGESMLTRVNARVEGVNVTQVLSAASPGSQKKITGTFEGDARLGVPLGATNPLAGASGEGTFAVRNGTFPGLDVQGTLAQMAKLLQIDVPAGDTRFSYFGGDFRISSARVHSEQLRLDAEALEASLRGSFGFDQTLNYSGMGLLKGQGTVQQQQSESSPLGGLRRVFGKIVQQSMNISGMRIPFTVRGTMQDPKILPGGVPQPIPQR